VTSSLTITGTYKTQYYLTVGSIYNSPTPTSGWFDAGQEITASVTSPWPGPSPKVQYVCTGWTGTVAVAGVFAILAWIGYTLATTPPPKPIEEIEKEIEKARALAGANRQEGA
jgi:hypothetical protein